MERTPPRLKFTFITDFVNVQELPHAPKGWENIKLNYHRSDFYYGMVRSFTVPIDYVKDGGYLLRKAFYGDPVTGRIGAGTLANVQIRVEKYNTVTYNYDIVYQGENDFSTFNDNGIEDGDTVTIEVMEGGITKYVKAYENVKYTIPISGFETINMTPIKLNEAAQFLFQGSIGEDQTIGTTLVTNDQKATVASVQNVDAALLPPPDFTTYGAWFYQATTDCQVHYTIANFTAIAPLVFGGGDLDIAIYSSSGAKIPIYRKVIVAGEFLAIDTTGVINVNANDKLFFYARFHDNGSVQINGGGTMLLQYQTSSPETQIAGIKAIDLYQQLLVKMNGFTPVPMQSYLLKQWDGLLLTSGLAIKPFTPSPIYAIDGNVSEGLIYQVYTDTVRYNGQDYVTGQHFTAVNVASFTSTNPDAYIQQAFNAPTIITSFKDFFTSVNAVLNAGWGVENEKAVLEAKSYFYKGTTTATDCGKVQKFKGGKPSTTNLFSLINGGYADQTYDQFNGSAEFNSTTSLTTPLVRINKTLDISSVYRADSIGAELLRAGINQNSQGTSSTSGNNDVWFMYCLPDGGNYRPEPATAFANLTGLSTNLYNLRISPRENITRHYDYLAGSMYGLKGEYLRFASGDKNVNISRIGSNGKIVTENADIPIDSLPPPIFLPFEATITLKEPVNFLSIINGNPTGSIKFEVHSGMMLTAFIIDVNTDIPLNSPQQINVLYTPNNNLLQFVR